MKNLLIVTTNFPPSTTIGTKRILKICKYLDKTEWKIFILTLHEKYYPEKNQDIEITSIVKNLDIFRTGKLNPVQFLITIRLLLKARKSLKKVKYFPPVTGDPAEKFSADFLKSPNLWTKFKDFFTDLLEFPDKNITWLPFAIIKGLIIVHRHKIDVIFSSSPPHSLHIISTLLNKLTNKRLILDFRDPWARSPWHEVQRASNKVEKSKYKIIQKLEKWVIKNANQVILVTEEMQKDFVLHYSYINEKRFKTIYNGYDPGIFKKFSHNYSKNNHRFKPITFVHTGSLYKLRDPSPIIFAIKNLIDQQLANRKVISFIFVGEIASHLSHIPSLVQEIGIGDIIQFYPPVSFKKSLEFIWRADILILLQPSTKLQLPGKFFDYICFDKPILAVAEKNSVTERMVHDRFGIFVNYNDLQDIQNGINFLIRNKTHCLNQIKVNRQYYDFSRTINDLSYILHG